MFFLSLLNGGLSLLYAIFEHYQIAPVGLAVFGGISLTFICGYLRKERRLCEEVLLNLVAVTVMLILCYSYVQNGESILWFGEPWLGGLMAATVMAFYLGLALSFSFEARFTRQIVLVMATVCTALPLFSYFLMIFL